SFIHHLSLPVPLLFFPLPAPTEVYTLSLHDALPILRVLGGAGGMSKPASARSYVQPGAFVRDVVNGLVANAGEALSSTSNTGFLDRKSTRLNSSHVAISYAVFCLKKKNRSHNNELYT